ncbi:hypothetical protein K491DRAFT_6291 [Lophiostoma macrostomum CBS 122681]|uniref:Uncharacterized protein n=1 Tax=Lophiostoma macrostomum CBS 122681 TaxID=1314788 RepID=A0A6A6TV84_9PLEO|nr:hypothetical protein K491DRAFT_6291 [Lophiostoma macrostomum CBS 122681]
MRHPRRAARGLRKPSKQHARPAAQRSQFHSNKIFSSKAERLGERWRSPRLASVLPQHFCPRLAVQCPIVNGDPSRWSRWVARAPQPKVDFAGREQPLAEWLPSGADKVTGEAQSNTVACHTADRRETCAAVGESRTRCGCTDTTAGAGHRSVTATACCWKT